VRHGKPALSRKVRLNWREYREWWKRYDLSGLADGQTVPKKLAAVMANADRVYASDLIRAVETATMAAGRAPDVVDKMFRRQGWKITKNQGDLHWKYSPSLSAETLSWKKAFQFMSAARR